MKSITKLIVAAASLTLVPHVNADIVDVDIFGTVIQNNYVPTHPLNAVTVGSPVHTSFQVDSNVFMNSTFPVRGYSIVPSSFVTTMGTTTLLLSPATQPPQPFFSIRNNDPAVDGFLISNGVDFPTRTPTNFNSAGYMLITSFPPTTLNSLNILDAFGTYPASSLSLLEWNLGVGDQVGIDISYSSMTIAPVPETASLAVALTGLGVLSRRGRRTS
jgi:hypothetical protein